MTNLYASDLDEFRGDISTDETRRQSPWTSNLQTVGIRYAGVAQQARKVLSPVDGCRTSNGGRSIYHCLRFDNTYQFLVH